MNQALRQDELDHFQNRVSDLTRYKQFINWLFLCQLFFNYLYGRMYEAVEDGLQVHLYDCAGHAAGNVTHLLQVLLLGVLLPCCSGKELRRGRWVYKNQNLHFLSSIIIRTSSSTR